MCGNRNAGRGGMTPGISGSAQAFGLGCFRTVVSVRGCQSALLLRARTWSSMNGLFFFGYLGYRSGRRSEHTSLLSLMMLMPKPFCIIVSTVALRSLTMIRLSSRRMMFWTWLKTGRDNNRQKSYRNVLMVNIFTIAAFLRALY
jgi:hypothetical protein